MTSEIRMLEAVTCGDRIIIAIVCYTRGLSGQGMVMMANPVALLISEAGKWMFFPLEEKTGTDILSNLSC